MASVDYLPPTLSPEAEKMQIEESDTRTLVDERPPYYDEIAQKKLRELGRRLWQRCEKMDRQVETLLYGFEGMPRYGRFAYGHDSAAFLMDSLYNTESRLDQIGSALCHWRVPSLDVLESMESLLGGIWEEIDKASDLIAILMLAKQSMGRSERLLHDWKVTRRARAIAKRLHHLIVRTEALRLQIVVQANIIPGER
ncbi:MAG: hypothetical protein M1825_001614 [Sarcosagium campestre]|nr:MAG: hypothetical protein M1825_001614 [Sarcosagium campestre]